MAPAFRTSILHQRVTCLKTSSFAPPGMELNMIRTVPLAAEPADPRNGTVIDIWYVNTRHEGLS